MPTPQSASKPEAPENGTQLEIKWGRAILDVGYTAIPDVLIRYQQRLQLKPLDVNVLLHLLTYWWKATNLPRPSKVTLATAINVDPSTIRRCLKKLEKMRYLTRIERRGRSGSRSNEYDLSGLVRALEPLANEEAAEIRKRKQRNLRKLAGRKPQLQAVK